MPLLYYTKETETRGKCYGVHNKPELLTKEQKAKGIEVNEVPVRPQTNKDEVAIRYVNPKTGKIWHEKQSRPLNEEEKDKERIEKVEADIKQIKNHLNIK